MGYLSRCRPFCDRVRIVCIFTVTNQMNRRMYTLIVMISRPSFGCGLSHWLGIWDLAPWNFIAYSAC
jgi:hypothetical protein